MSKAFIIGGATVDNIIRYEDMETLVHQRQGFEQAYLLLEEGRKIEVLEQHVFTGGGATNAAVSLKKQGYETHLFCRIGQDANGDLLIRELQSFGLKTDYIKRDVDIGTASSFVVPSLSGDRTVFAYRGANAGLNADNIPQQQLKGSSFCYVTSLSKAAAKQMPDIAKACQNHQVPLAVNPGISQLKLGSGFLKNALHDIDTLILNYEEAKQFMSSLLQTNELLREKLQQQASRQNACNKLIDSTVVVENIGFTLRQFFRHVLNKGPTVVVVTDGSAGVYVATSQTLYFHPSLKVHATNTLGAGDAFGSSFVGHYYQHRDIGNAMRYGVINSASVVQQPDAKSGLLTDEQLKQEFAKLDKRLLETTTWSL